VIPDHKRLEKIVDVEDLGGVHREMPKFISFCFVCVFSLTAISLSSGCVTMSPEEIAARQEALRSLELKAKSGDLLTVREWNTLLRGGSDNRTDKWLYALIGRPDETINDPDCRRGIFLIYKNKVLDDFTGKPTGLVVQYAYGYLDRFLYSEEAVKRQR
jgi:hypothetical protein